MNKEWYLSNDKAIINFSQNYCKTETDVLNSKTFNSVLKNYIKHAKRLNSKICNKVNKILNLNEDVDGLTNQSIKLFKQLLINDSKSISEELEEFKGVYENRVIFRAYIEEIYTYWRNLERYAVIMDDKLDTGIINMNFMDAKEEFDSLLINLYRKISNNVSINKPNVYRQLAAGTNAALIVKNYEWDIPKEYEILKDVPMVKEAILRAPFITYPKRNKRSGIFMEMENPLSRAEVDVEKLFCFPVLVGENLAYVYAENDFLSHAISLCNLFEMPRIEDLDGRKPELLVLFGLKDLKEDKKNGYFIDEKNEMIVGYISKSEEHDYFGYMKKIILAVSNIYNIRRGKLPLHGSMVKIELKTGDSANVVIIGDSGAGKSESIEAFRVLAEEYISSMTVIFDDMGTFSIEDGKIIAYGTETGAFVRLDDLDPGYAFKELDRSIFMNPDKINARLITPVSEYSEVIAGEEVDFFLYANNYTIPENDGVEIIENFEVAKENFIKGRRMAKGTTTENGIIDSFFANPFGPRQLEAETRKIIDEVFEVLKATNKKVGVIYTQLGIKGMEKEGPKKAAVKLFDLIKELRK